MRLAFVNPDLLDQTVDETFMPEELERFWHERAGPLAKSLYARIGITERVPFVLDQYSNPPQIHHQSSSVLRKMTEQVAGRTTMRTYGQHVLRFIATLAEDGGDLATVDPGYLSQYRARRLASTTPQGKPLDPVSWNSEAAALKTMFDAAVLLRLRPDNPTEHPALQWSFKGAAAASEEPKFITLDRFRIFRDDGLMVTRSPLRNAAFAETILTSGMRLYECSRMPASAVPSRAESTGGRAFTYPVPAIDGKGYRARKVPVGIHAFRRLQAYQQLERLPALERKGLSASLTPLWINQSGGLMGIGGWEKVFENASERSGIKVTPHTLRHTFAVYMLCALLRRHHDSMKIKDDVRRLTTQTDGSWTVVNLVEETGVPRPTLYRYKRELELFQHLGASAPHGGAREELKRLRSELAAEREAAKAERARHRNAEAVLVERIHALSLLVASAMGEDSLPRMIELSKPPE